MVSVTLGENEGLGEDPKGKETGRKLQQKNGLIGFKIASF